MSTRMRNLMTALIGKSYMFKPHGRYMWTVTIKGLLRDTGYFITEVNYDGKVWQSNCSYGEVTSNMKKGTFIELTK